MAQPSAQERASRISLLLDCIGIAPESFFEFVEWALSEHLLAVLTSAPDGVKRDWIERRDGMRMFRDHLRARTRRDWSVGDMHKLFERLKAASERHYRHPVPYGEYLKLLWNVDECCARCGKEPPEVCLHIDHIHPVKHGGESQAVNLQFLCGTCNLEKGAKLPEGEPWLKLD